MSLRDPTAILPAVQRWLIAEVALERERESLHRALALREREKPEALRELREAGYREGDTYIASLNNAPPRNIFWDAGGLVQYPRDDP